MNEIFCACDGHSGRKISLKYTYLAVFEKMSLPSEFIKLCVLCMCGLNKLIAFCGGKGTRKCKEKVVHEHKSFCWGVRGWLKREVKVHIHNIQ